MILPSLPTVGSQLPTPFEAVLQGQQRCLQEVVLQGFQLLVGDLAKVMVNDNKIWARRPVCRQLLAVG